MEEGAEDGLQVAFAKACIVRNKDDFFLLFPADDNDGLGKNIKFSQDDLLGTVNDAEVVGIELYFFAGALLAIQYIEECCQLPNPVGDYILEDAIANPVEPFWLDFLFCYEKDYGLLPLLPREELVDTQTGLTL